MTATMNVFTFFIIFTSLIAAAKKPDSDSGYFHDAVDQATSAVSFPKGDGKGLSADLICDGSGACRETMTKAVGKAKDTVTETAKEAGEMVREVVDWKMEAAAKTGEAISDAFGAVKKMAADEASDVKEKVTETAHGAEEAVSEAIDWTKEVAREVGEAVGDTARKIKRVASKKASDMKDTSAKAAKAAEEIPSYAETATQHVVMNVSEALETDVNEEERNKHKPMKHSRRTLAGTMSLVNLLGFASAYGEGLWVTFVWSSALKTCLPRKQLDMVEKKMYYLYYRTMTSSISMALIGHSFGEKELFTNKTYKLQNLNLLASLLMVSLNLFYLKPQKDKIIYERMKMEKEEGKDSAAKEEAEGKKPGTMERMNQRVKKLNSYSSWLNLMTLLALTWHFDYLGQRLSKTL